MGVSVRLHLFDVETYREKVLPAYSVFLGEDDPAPLAALFTECAEVLDAHPELSRQLFLDREIIEEDIGILTGEVYYSPDGGQTSNQGEGATARKLKRNYARELASGVLRVLCVARDRGVDPEQDMSRTPLLPYLYEKSEWIKDVFTFARPVGGTPLELTIGEDARLFTDKELQVFITELDKVPPPDAPDLRAEYDNLRALLRLASESSNLALVLSLT